MITTQWTFRFLSSLPANVLAAARKQNWETLVGHAYSERKAIESLMSSCRHRRPAGHLPDDNPIPEDANLAKSHFEMLRTVDTSRSNAR